MTGSDSPPRWNTWKRTGKVRSRQVRSLGPADRIVQWYKPYARPVWMSEQDYAALPLMLTVRECQSRVKRQGFGVREITPGSTLLDAEAYPAEALADLDFQRWQVETDLATEKPSRGWTSCGARRRRARRKR